MGMYTSITGNVLSTCINCLSLFLTVMQLLKYIAK